MRSLSGTSFNSSSKSHKREIGAMVTSNAPPLFSETDCACVKMFSVSSLSVTQSLPALLFSF